LENLTSQQRQRADATMIIASKSNIKPFYMDRTIRNVTETALSQQEDGG
jgi:hypothetical protein